MSDNIKEPASTQQVGLHQLGNSYLCLSFCVCFCLFVDVLVFLCVFFVFSKCPNCEQNIKKPASTQPAGLHQLGNSC